MQWFSRIELCFSDVFSVTNLNWKTNHRETNKLFEVLEIGSLFWRVRAEIDERDKIHSKWFLTDSVSCWQDNMTNANISATIRNSTEFLQDTVKFYEKCRTQMRECQNAAKKNYMFYYILLPLIWIVLLANFFDLETVRTKWILWHKNNVFNI